jgi:hypothetical protein
MHIACWITKNTHTFSVCNTRVYPKYSGWRCKNLTTKRTWKLPTSTQLRHTDSPDMVVLPSTGVSHYHNCCIDGGISLEYFGYTVVILAFPLQQWLQERTSMLRSTLLYCCLSFGYLAFFRILVLVSLPELNPLCELRLLFLTFLWPAIFCYCVISWRGSMLGLINEVGTGRIM